MIKTFFYFIFFWVYQLLLYPKLRKNMKNRTLPEKSADNELMPVDYNNIYETTKKWGQALVKRTGSNVRVIGSENIPKNDTVLFVSNHQGNFDIPIILGYVDKPKGFIAKKELQKLPLVGRWMELMNCVFIDRDDKRKSIKALAQAASNISNGYSLVLFPEGTRSRSGRLGEFKASISTLLKKSNAKVVPLSIIGSYKIMEANNNKIKSADVTLVIDKPFETAGLEKKEIDDLINKIRDLIAANLEKYE